MRQLTDKTLDNDEQSMLEQWAATLALRRSIDKAYGPDTVYAFAGENSVKIGELVLDSMTVQTAFAKAVHRAPSPDLLRSTKASHMVVAFEDQADADDFTATVRKVRTALAADNTLRR